MILKLAWRNIWRNKMRSLVIIWSVGIGLFTGIAVLALYKGMLRSRVYTVIHREIGHLQIHNENFKKDYEAVYTIPEKEALITYLAQQPEIGSIALRTVAQGMLATTTGSAGVQIHGVDARAENAVSQLNKKIIEGNGFDTNRLNQVLIGKKLADRLQIKKGNKIVLTVTDKENNISSGAYRIAGIYQTVNTPLDERTVYIQRQSLNSLLGVGEDVHEIAILLQQDQLLRGIQQKIQHQFPLLLVENWQQISPETELMVTFSNQYMYIILIVIMLALAFGIVNTMLMAVLERTREIGMITALGMNQPKLFTLILCETILLTLAGTPAGLGMGWLATKFFSRKGIDISSFSEDAMSSFGYESVIYPEFPYEKLSAVMLIVFFTAVAAAVLPCIKALKLQPVDALRK